jgi:hypothetical protein
MKALMIAMLRTFAAAALATSEDCRNGAANDDDFDFTQAYKWAEVSEGLTSIVETLETLQ